MTLTGLKFSPTETKFPQVPFWSTRLWRSASPVTSGAAFHKSANVSSPHAITGVSCSIDHGSRTRLSNSRQKQFSLDIVVVRRSQKESDEPQKGTRGRARAVIQTITTKSTIIPSAVLLSEYRVQRLNHAEEAE